MHLGRTVLFDQEPVVRRDTQDSRLIRGENETMRLRRGRSPRPTNIERLDKNGSCAAEREEPLCLPLVPDPATLRLLLGIADRIKALNLAHVKVIAEAKCSSLVCVPSTLYG